MCVCVCVSAWLSTSVTTLITPGGACLPLTHLKLRSDMSCSSLSISLSVFRRSPWNVSSSTLCRCVFDISMYRTLLCMNSERDGDSKRERDRGRSVTYMCMGQADSLAASSSFKLILNGIRSGCHNPQDQPREQPRPCPRPGAG